MFRNAEIKRKNRIRSLEEKKFKSYLKSCQIAEYVYFTQEYKTVVDRRGSGIGLTFVGTAMSPYPEK
ncbi:MAG: hypothetical protein LBD03_04180 [Methanobrevibacter sp.]|nr:hypothetical protein [Candidatus Methanovirga procula]